MGWVGKLIGGTVLATAAFVAGSIAGSNAQPEPPLPKTVYVPHYIAGPTKTVTKNTIPDACRDAIQRARTIESATERYENDLGGADQLIDEAWRAAQSGDVREVNKVKQKKIKLDAASIADLLTLRDAQHDLTQLQPKCEAQTR